MKKLTNTNASILTLRQELQQRSSETALRLSRSVGRAASVDLLPCTEYAQEVAAQHQLAEELLFLQHCRAALERAVDKGGSRLVWRWQRGGSTQVRFRRQNNCLTMQVRQSKDMT
ncbi:MAG: hypothetical protein E7469_01840 [Ruminococcaceae bacterium]|nr:hypothetical protein [Oscillospiraceae bacterium]